jgi:RNA polymerase sigma-70 factor (ECF subfamily)
VGADAPSSPAETLAFARHRGSTMKANNDVATSPTLLRQIWTPDSHDEAWRTFLERYLPMIHNWCRRAGLNANDADEVSAAVLNKLVRAMRTFVYDPAKRFRGWLKTVVDNQVRDFRRQLLRHPGDYGSGHPDVHRALERIEAPATLEELVDSLDQRLERDWQLAQQVTAVVQGRVRPETWTAFWRTAIEKEPAGAVAKSLGLSIGAVYMAKQRVAKMVREEGLRLKNQSAGENGGVP